MHIPRSLVVGATGRIGQVLRHVWRKADADSAVRWQSRRPLPDHICFAPLEDAAAFETACQDCAVILCLAGVISAQHGPLADNAALAEASIRVAVKTGARVLLVSSAAVYGSVAGVLAETTPLHPVSDYGQAKGDMEQSAIALAAELSVTLSILRIGNVAGLDAILGGWKPGFRLDAFAEGGSPKRSYIGLRDLARVIAALMALPAPPAIINIASPAPIEMHSLLDAAGLTWTPRPAPATAIPMVCLDTALLQSLAPVAPPTARDLVDQWRAVQPFVTPTPQTA